MQEARIGDDGEHVRGQVEQDVGGGEDQAGRLHDGDVARAHGVDEELPQPRIDEHHLDDHHSHDQVGEVDHDDVDDRRQRVGERVLDDDAPARQALQRRHLDVGAGQQVDDRRPRHAHHVRDHHQRQRQRRQDGAVDPVPEPQLVADVGDAREPAEMDRHHEDQDVGDEELGEGDGAQREDVDRAVVEGVAVERRQDAEGQRQRNRDDRGDEREEQRVLQAHAHELGNLALVGERLTEIALHDAAEPGDVALVRRQVELQLAAKRGDRLRRRPLAEQGLRDVSRQQLDAEKDDQRDGEQGEEAQREALGHHDRYLRHAAVRRLPLADSIQTTSARST